MLKKSLILAAVLSISGISAFAQNEATLKRRIQERAAAVEQLLGSGLAQEVSTGLLKSSGQLDAAQAAALQDENKDREAIFVLIASKSGLTADKVAKMYAARARKAPVAAISEGAGPCKLVPAKPEDVAKLIQYLKQGMNYASQKKYELAVPEFQAGLAIDKNFLGLNQNVGSAQLALKKYAEAETALKAELKLVDCLTPLTNAQLATFGYFIEVEERDPAARSQARSEKLKAQLPMVKAESHYNLACLYSLQKQKDQALTELQAAVDAGFSDRKALDGDADLAFIRGASEFREIVAKVH